MLPGFDGRAQDLWCREMGMPRSKQKDPNTEAMKTFIEETMASIGATFKFEGDGNLVGYRKGEPMRMRELRALPDGAVVFITYKEHGGRGYRINSAYRLEIRGEDNWFFDDGSSFATDFQADGLGDDEVAYDEAGGEGDFFIHHAVPKATRKKTH